MTGCGLVDLFGRRISYLRLSVTDRCDLRCVYCMSEDMTFLPRNQLLTLEELDRLACAFVRRGVRRIRLTGGEPLVRKGLMELVSSLSRHLVSGCLDELTLTTNGTLLAHHAQALARAGVKRINVSLDTLDAARFRAITRRGNLGVVMEGLLAAQEAGLRIKLNAVALKDVTEHEIHDLIAFAHGRGMDLTLIETMPLGDVGADRTDQYLPLSTLRRIIESRWTLTDTSERSGGPARYARVAETGGRIGFITPLTHSFCETCNRVRVSATGVLYTCLGQEAQVDLRTPLRASEGDALLHAAIDAGIRAKPRGHDFAIAGNGRPALSRHMSALGG
ncbi:cyclic pyranopterin monophosphate synthase [Azorhizobium oxalatiphilum]|uniref:GTP 3',8-cyclase n=1 Tax=Azorhizobium oxalatiphilum TaxID=980631 RepID=A0A917BPG4_9HYPH|nr:GTP 3',8-cyclase MoaA [Azorhizobium oxalatiphilum]GGF52358.1 cyclic pyranopterin monophosphate synthase [Azorhizobium oxalatiphilum]